jgi:hypothetical protein
LQSHQSWCPWIGGFGDVRRGLVDFCESCLGLLDDGFEERNEIVIISFSTGS